VLTGDSAIHGRHVRARDRARVGEARVTGGVNGLGGVIVAVKIAVGRVGVAVHGVQMRMGSVASAYFSGLLAFSPDSSSNFVTYSGIIASSCGAPWWTARRAPLRSM
jgi:hypothetical protein